jgi:hypothetical protein
MFCQGGAVLLFKPYGCLINRLGQTFQVPDGVVTWDAGDQFCCSTSSVELLSITFEVNDLVLLTVCSHWKLL